MASDAIQHHLIPQTYMEPWCFSGNTIWTFNKDTGEWKDRNIEKICRIKFFHSIRANSTYVTAEALREIWAHLDNYQIFLDGEPLDTYEKRHLAYHSFDNWEILNPDGSRVKKSKRNYIKTQLQDARDNSIEEQWNIQFENGWLDIITVIRQALGDIQEGKPIMLTSRAASELMKYIVMFDWRGFSGNKELNEAFAWLDSLLPFSEADIPQAERVLPMCDNALIDARHNFLLKQFDEFQTGRGVMYRQQKVWEERYTFIFLIPPQGHSFISSDNPCFRYMDSNGYTEPFFVALPQLAIILARKDPNAPNAYAIRELTESELAECNSQIYFHANTLVLNNAPFDTSIYSAQDVNN